METPVLIALIAAVATIAAAIIAKLAIGRDARPEATTGSDSEVTEVEILLPLQRKYGPSLRPTLRSVKFCQVGGRCFLRLTMSELVAGYLQNEVIKQDDLGFISDDASPDGLYFSPTRPLAENARRFLEEFDEIGIINGTDLFTEEAASEVAAKSQQN